MADILHYYDLNQASSSWKSSNKLRGDGFEAPRNSFDFAAAVSHVHCAFDENAPYSCQVLHRLPRISYVHRGATMKKLIDDEIEISNRANGRHNPPNVVARLMGMDPTPARSSSAIRRKEIEVRKPGRSAARRHAVIASSAHGSWPLPAPSEQTKCSLLSYSSQRDSGRPRKARSRPTLREHPQEELLQKFKKDFEEWQASNVLKHSKALLGERSATKGKYAQILAQEKLNTEKMARYAESKRNPAEKKPLELTRDVSIPHLKFETSEKIASNLKNKVDFGDCEGINDYKELQVTKAGDAKEMNYSPTRIIILRPSFERSVGSRESWVGSTEINEDCSMEEFLDEVKRRLKNEVQEKCRSDTRKGESRNDTLFSERSTDPKQIAHEIAKHIRESVTRDIGTKLTRSESTKSYRSEFKRDTRRILEEKLKNMLKNETDLENGYVGNEASVSTRNKERAKLMSDFSNVGWEDKKTTTESIPRRKREVELSDWPRNLLRSFSAPVPGSAFGKLLLEDQHILTGAHIRRRHELSEKRTSREAKKNRRENFSLKGRVLNLKENFTLKGKLFGKKTRSAKKAASSECNSLNVIKTVPSAVMHCGITKDNATEVPPSPVSISSSSRNESRTPDNPSPVSPLEVQLTDSQPSQCFVEDLTFDLPEVSDQSEQVEKEEAEESATKEETETETETENSSDMFEIKSDEEVYIRDILIAAGFYEGRYSSYKSPRSDATTSPISYQVFEEVEEAYNRSSKIENKGSRVVHKLLFDLVNEALRSVIDNSRNGSSTLRRWALERGLAPRNKKLLSDLWRRIRVYGDLPMDELQTIDSITARDVKMTPWNRKFYDDIDASGKKIECAIFGDLVDDFAREMCFDGAANELHILRRNNLGL